MIERTLAFGGVSKASKMLDVGCGIGGSSRYICNKLGCSGEGVSLSPDQVGGRLCLLAVASDLSGTAQQGTKSPMSNSTLIVFYKPDGGGWPD